MTLLRDKDFGTPSSNSSHMVMLEIDGCQVEVAEGTSIMRAAAEAGLSIPKLCATDSVNAFGSCRLCLVEVEGRRGTPSSLHHTSGRQHGRPYPDAPAGGSPPWCDGTLHLGSSAGLPHLFRQWRLRTARHGRCGWLERRAVRLRG